MLVVLGKRDAIQAYFNSIGGVNLGDVHDYLRLPANFHHYTEYTDLIITIKKYNPRILVTQSLEFLDTLLESDLDFNVIRTKITEDKLLTCEITKQKVKQFREAWAFDPR